MSKETFKSTREAILNQIDIYLESHTDISDEGFGWLAIKDASLVGRLRLGKDITTRKLDDILSFLQQSKEE